MEQEQAAHLLRGRSNAKTSEKETQEKKEMKCPRCKSRGDNPPDFKLKQHRDSNGKEEVYMQCPKCGYVGGSIKGR